MLGKGRMDRAEALVEPGHVELRGHGGGGGWRYYVSGPVDLLRHASGWKKMRSLASRASTPQSASFLAHF